MKRSLAPLMLILVALPAFSAPVGSGTVHFEFTSFDGAYGGCGPTPMEICINGYYMTGLTSPVAYSELTWSSVFTRTSGAQITFGSVPAAAPKVFDSGVSEVKFGDASTRPGTLLENILRFTPENFVNVEMGQAFKIGTIFYQNGSWPGGTPSSADNIPSNFHFRLWTESGDLGFTQEITGTIQQIVNAPDPLGIISQEAADFHADWITISSPANEIEFQLFKVYDPHGGTYGDNWDSIDVMARFNSLHLVGFSDPNPGGGGFLVSANGVPIGSTAPLVGIGLAALLAARRGSRRLQQLQAGAV